MRYEQHAAECVKSAEQWDRAAETARTGGDFSAAAACEDRARKLRYLSTDDEEVRRLFDEAEKM